MSLAATSAFAAELNDLCELACRRNRIVVAAKRNMPLEDNGFPAELSSCLGVDMADLSSPYILQYCPHPPIEFAGQGVDVLTPTMGGGYKLRSATSYATPAITGLVALLLGQFPELRFVVPQACFDHLGRPVQLLGKTLKVGSAPLYAVLPRGTHPELAPPPKAAQRLGGEPGPVVLQAVLPEQDLLVKQSAYRFAPAQSKQVSVFVYNFSETRLRGKLSVAGPKGWKLSLPAEAEIGPGEWQQLALGIACANTNCLAEGTVRLHGDFGAAGLPVLALRFSGGDK